jgi:hypothetical protein
MIVTEVSLYYMYWNIDKEKKKKMLYILYVVIFLIELLIDFTSDQTRMCLSNLQDEKEKSKVISMLLFHHFIATFMMYGWLLPNKFLLVLFMVASFIMMSEWSLTGKCRLTTYVNDKCGQKGNFRDLLWKLDLKEVSLPIATLFLVFGVLHYNYFDKIYH